MTRRALLLPGRAYPVDLPLLADTGALLERHGWPVRPVSWTLPEQVRDHGAWVADRAVEAVGGDPGPWLFAAKSLGTRVVQSGPIAAAYVLLTPLLTDPDVTSRITALVADGAQILLVGGTADELWSTAAAASTGAEVHEVPGADHAMADAHAEVARAVDSFLAGLGR